MARIRERNGRWTVEIRKGKFKHSPIIRTFGKKTVAKQFIIDTENAIEKGEFIDFRNAKAFKFGDLIDRYVKEVTMTKSDETIVREKNRLEKLKEDLGNKTVDRLDTTFLYGYFSGLLKRKGTKTGRYLSPSTVMKRAKDVSGIMRVADRIWHFPLPHGNAGKEAIQRMNEMGLLKEQDYERDTRLVDGQYELIRHFRPESKSLYKFAALFFIETGMRRGEFLDMVGENIDFRNRVYHLAKQKSDRTRTRLRKGRDVPLTLRAAAILRLVMWKRDRTGRVWPWTCGSSVYNGIQRMFSKLGIEGVRVHDLRHEFGSYHAEEGLDIRLIGAAMGHADLKSTKRYTHPNARKIAGLFKRK